MFSLFHRKRYLISGIGIGSSGVGRLMKVLVPKYHAAGYHVIARRTPTSLRHLLDLRCYFGVAQELFYRSLNYFSFLFRCCVIFNSDVVLLHPQSTGYLLFFFLVCFNKVSLYVMDNSFFCICSYNTHPVNHNECLHCIRDICPHPYCLPSPVKYSKILNVFYLKFLKCIPLIKFLAQNHLQSQLLICILVLISMSLSLV